MIFLLGMWDILSSWLMNVLIQGWVRARVVPVSRSIRDPHTSTPGSDVNAIHQLTDMMDSPI